MSIFKDLFFALNQEGVKYMVAGGIAVNLYGIDRATADIDIALQLNMENLVGFLKVTKSLGLKAKFPVKLEDLLDSEKRQDWITNKNMVVFSFYDPETPFFLLDIFIEVPFDFERTYKKRTRVKFEGITIPVVPIATLIEMKEGSNRPQDRADVFYLRKIMEEWKGEE